MATGASAATLPCVQRAIDHNAASSNNYVSFSLVALHESGPGTFASGTMANSHCSRAPYSAGTVRCLVSMRSVDALLLQPGAQNGSRFIALGIDGIPLDTLGQVHMHQPNATYDFDPKCVGNLLTGDDQWGNRWTLAFQLGTSSMPR
jgi:hypothetical protein